jgi:hypothetical protein
MKTPQSSISYETFLSDLDYAQAVHNEHMERCNSLLVFNPGNTLFNGNPPSMPFLSISHITGKKESK